MYYLAIRQFARGLKNLDSILDKAKSHAEQRKFDVNNFVGQRLFVDMLPFAAQIRIATDMAKAAAGNLSGKAAPRFEDNETTFEQLQARVRRTVDYLNTLTAADFEKVNSQTVINIPYPPGKALHAEEYLLGRQIPNFYFHVTTAYNLLRQAGVEIGKMDYIGDLNLLEAR